MITDTPAAIAHDAFEPFRALLGGLLMTPKQLAMRWQYTDDHIYNLIKGGKLPSIKLPTGGVRFHVADVLAAELSAKSGPVTLAGIRLAISSCEDVAPADRAKVLKHVEKLFGS